MNVRADQETNSEAAPTFDQWAIVDVMGHQRYIGRVTEQVVAGKGFVRVDVPAVDDERPGFTKLLGVGSIYAISPVTEEIAREMSRRRTQTPIEAYELPKPPALPSPTLEPCGDAFNCDEEDSF